MAEPLKLPGDLSVRASIVAAFSEGAFDRYVAMEVSDRVVGDLAEEGFGEADLVVVESFGSPEDDISPPLSRGDIYAKRTREVLVAEYKTKGQPSLVVGNQAVVTEKELLPEHLEARFHDFPFNRFVNDARLARDRQQLDVAYIAVLGVGRLTPNFNVIQGGVLNRDTVEEFAKDMGRMRQDTMRDGGILALENGEWRQVSLGNKTGRFI